ncbi:secretory protein [bacterium]|nr:MAG: secretory protein [bacterium]
MKNIFFFSIICMLGYFNSTAQSVEMFKQKDYKLTFESQDIKFSPDLKEKLIKTFWTVYPELAKAYNLNTSKNVTFVIDTAYTGVAATSNDRVVFSSKYMIAHPNDIDVVTHEVMHIVQAYGENAGPGWLTEGIADYARYKFGVNNTAANWVLPAYKVGQSYENSYRITARFLVWLENSVKPGIVKELDEQLRAHAFTENSWKKLTGKSLDELWLNYTANPVI